MGIYALRRICTYSHYKKSITQTAAKVKSFPILMGANFQESKKGFGGGGRYWGDFCCVQGTVISYRVEPGNEIMLWKN